MKVDIGISAKNRTSVISLLNTLLSDEYLLYTKTLNFHWNITGSSFAELHKFLEEQYKTMQEMIDEVAERTRKLGGKSFGTLKEFIQHTRLKETPGSAPRANDMLSLLLHDHEAIIIHLRKDQEDCDKKYKDVGTMDFLTGLMEQHEQMAWMLRSYLEK